MNKNLCDSLDSLAQSRGIDIEELLCLLENAILSAARKATKYTRDVAVHIDRKTYEYTCTARLIVVEEIQNPGDEITLKEVHRVFPNAQVGDEVEWVIHPTDFGRIASQAAHQMMTQGLRQAERKMASDSYQDKIGQLITGTVRRIDRDGIVIGFQNYANPNQIEVTGLLRRDEKIPGETIDVGEQITVLLVDIDTELSGPSLRLTRKSPVFVERLFEREVTEIMDHLVEIKGVARDPGYRSKVAVTSNEPRIDPVGACVGMRGMRVKNIVRDLGGEKVDIILWNADIKTYVENALKPAHLQNVRINQDTKSIRVEVPEDQFSLSIGKKGQNARLASQLTGWRIDIERAESTVAQKDDLETSIRKAIDAIGAVEGIGPEAAEILVKNGYASLEGISAPEVEIADIANLPGFDAERAEAVVAAAKAALGR